tara:strand:- start:10989 stop:11942 length:954 start_codon:yes stop_codon:yes gene_type:complete
MTSLTALDRLRRLLAVIPWVVEKDGPLIDEIVERFDYRRSELLEDLEHVLFFVGVHPFTPDCLIDVIVAEERVWIRYADWFRRPMRLGAAEKAALYAAGRSVAAITDDEELGPLERALTKLAGSMASGDNRAVEVRLGPGSIETIDIIRAAVADQTTVDIDYYSYGRDVDGQRLVDPYRFYADKGHWYVSGHCHKAGSQRVFRVDRISRCESTSLSFDPPDAPADTIDHIPTDGDLPAVVVELAAEARWVIEEYPHSGVQELSDGSVRVSLPVSSPQWLERLLLRLGPTGSVVEAPEGLGIEVRSAAARRILAVYGV